MTDGNRQHAFTVPAESAGIRIDRYLAGVLPDVSRAQIQRAAKADALTVDGRPVKVSHRVRSGEQVSVTLIRPEDPGTPPRPEAIDLDILREDDAVIVINKPAGMVVHPAAGHHSGTLVNALLGRGLLGDATGPVDRPGIVHRLDKGTSGLIICARTESAHRHLGEQLRDRTLKRTYLAVIWGHLKTETQVFDDPIGRSIRDRKRMAVREAGRSARTTVKVIERFDLADLLEVTLETGRTHQIRVHVTHAGHPIVGDSEYGGGLARLKGIHPDLRLLGRRMLKAMPRPALHAKQLRFNHPGTGERIKLSVEPPQDFLALLQICREAAQ